MIADQSFIHAHGPARSQRDPQCDPSVSRFPEQEEERQQSKPAAGVTCWKAFAFFWSMEFFGEGTEKLFIGVVAVVTLNLTGAGYIGNGFDGTYGARDECR